MFAPDPARAAREIRRVLRPGGRVAIAVWGPRERNPWLGARVRRRQRPDRRAGAAARRAGPVLARRLRAGSPRCSRDAGLARRARRRAADAAARRLVRGVVGAHLGARRAARQASSRRCPSRPAGAARPRCGEAVAPYTTPTGSRSPGVTLIASAGGERGGRARARNLGGAITRDLLAHGVRVATVARTPADLDRAARQTGALADPRRRGRSGAAPRGALEQAAAELGPPDLIVNAVSAARPPDDRLRVRRRRARGGDRRRLRRLGGRRSLGRRSCSCRRMRARSRADARDAGADHRRPARGARIPSAGSSRPAWRGRARAHARGGAGAARRRDSRRAR